MVGRRRRVDVAIKKAKLSATQRFNVSRRVHHLSWGERKKTMRNKCTLWSKTDFIVGEMIGKGHFGNIFRAIYRRNENETCRKAYSLLENSSIVALKCFSKSAILSNHNEGGRTLQLLRREINIHSQ
jgi:serine/threonine protein kinase